MPEIEHVSPARQGAPLQRRHPEGTREDHRPYYPRASRVVGEAGRTHGDTNRGYPAEGAPTGGGSSASGGSIRGKIGSGFSTLVPAASPPHRNRSGQEPSRVEPSWAWMRFAVAGRNGSRAAAMIRTASARV